MLAPAAEAELYIEIARVRAAPSAKVVVSSASVDGAAIAAPMPCSCAGAEQPCLRLREAAEQGGADEQAEPGDEDAAPAEQVAQACAEQQQAAEGQRVGVLHPGQPGGREAEIGVDLGKGGDDDRRVEHDHQLDGEDDREDDGGGFRGGCEGGSLPGGILEVGSESARMETPSGKYGVCLRFFNELYGGPLRFVKRNR